MVPSAFQQVTPEPGLQGRKEPRWLGQLSPAALRPVMTEHFVFRLCHLHSMYVFCMYPVE